MRELFFEILLFILLPFLTGAEETDQEEQGSDIGPSDNNTDEQEDDASIVTTAVVLFSIVFLGFLWLFYENNRKVKVQNRALDKTERSRPSFGASLVSNSFTAIPMHSPHEKDGHTHDLPLKSGDSTVSVGDRQPGSDVSSPNSSTPDSAERKRRYTPSGMAGAFIDESELNKRDTLIPSQSEINTLKNQQSSVIELQDLDDDSVLETPAVLQKEEIESEVAPNNSVHLVVEDDEIDEKTGGSEVDGLFNSDAETQTPLPVGANSEFQKLDTNETFAALKGIEAAETPTMVSTPEVLDVDDKDKQEKLRERDSMRL